MPPPPQVPTWINGFHFIPAPVDELQQARQELRLLIFPGTQALLKQLIPGASLAPPPHDKDKGSTDPDSQDDMGLPATAGEQADSDDDDDVPLKDLHLRSSSRRSKAADPGEGSGVPAKDLDLGEGGRQLKDLDLGGTGMPAKDLDLGEGGRPPGDLDLGEGGGQATDLDMDLGEDDEQAGDLDSEAAWEVQARASSPEGSAREEPGAAEVKAEAVCHTEGEGGPAQPQQQGEEEVGLLPNGPRYPHGFSAGLDLDSFSMA